MAPTKFTLRLAKKTNNYYTPFTKTKKNWNTFDETLEYKQ